MSFLPNPIARILLLETTNCKSTFSHYVMSKQQSIIISMKIKVLLLIALMLGFTAFAQQETKNEPVSHKRVNNTLGVCMMGKTMQCNGITVSYIPVPADLQSAGF